MTIQRIEIRMTLVVLTLGLVLFGALTHFPLTISLSSQWLKQQPVPRVPFEGKVK